MGYELESDYAEPVCRGNTRGSKKGEEVELTASLIPSSTTTELCLESSDSTTLSFFSLTGTVREKRILLENVEDLS